MIDEFRGILFFMALGKIAIFCLFAVAIYFIFKNDVIRLYKYLNKLEQQQDELHKQKIELMKAKTEAIKNQNSGSLKDMD